MGAAENDAAIAAALRGEADALETTISHKGTAARALAPGKSYAVAWLRDRANSLLAGGHDPAGDSLPPAGRERLGVPPASVTLPGVRGPWRHAPGCPSQDMSRQEAAPCLPACGYVGQDPA